MVSLNYNQIIWVLVGYSGNLDANMVHGRCNITPSELLFYADIGIEICITSNILSIFTQTPVIKLKLLQRHLNSLRV